MTPLTPALLTLTLTPALLTLTPPDPDPSPLTMTPPDPDPTDPERLDELHVLAELVVRVAGHVARVVVLDVVPGAAERVPDVLSLPCAAMKQTLQGDNCREKMVQSSAGAQLAPNVHLSRMQQDSL